VVVIDSFTLQGSLLGACEPTVDASAAFERVELDDHCWIDIATGWLAGGDDLFTRLVAQLAWQEHRRPMYDRIVAVPRLTATIDLDDPAVPGVLSQGAARLGRRYERRFERLGFNLYRTGADSVAWHGDRIGRYEVHPIVGILTLGGARPFALRRKGGGSTRRLVPGCGDLMVMGGLVQTRWEHSVPKVADADPRLSVMFRYGPDGRVPVGARDVTPRAPSESLR
jgi:alkylated DNA repair dioxygenase AlkB